MISRSRNPEVSIDRHFRVSRERPNVVRTISASITRGKSQNRRSYPGFTTYQYSGPRQEQTKTYDASGRATSIKDKWPLLGANAWQEDETVHVFDGDGNPVISKARMRTSADQTWPSLTTVSYQVWSSVLGKSLTTVEPNGDLIGTKVFAGGAHIATGDVWKTADPVTGTTSFYAGDGTYAMKEEESEPLGGQSVELTQPPGYNSNYGEVLGVAKDPEFQCHMTFDDGTSFRLMPKVCNEVMSKGMENKFTTLSKKEKSPANVPQHSFLSMPNGYGPSDDRLAYSAKSTKKPKDEEGKAKCEPGYPCLPEENVNVPISPVDVTDTGIDASQSGELGQLSSIKNQAITNALGEVAGRLEKNIISDKCRQDVLEKLKTLRGFDEKKFLDFLKLGGNFFNGESTTMLMNKFDTEKNWGSKTVSQRFDDQGGLSAVVAIGSEFKKLTVFFDPDAIDTNAKVSSVNGQKMVGLTNDNLALAFHEALHGYGNNIGSLKGNYDDDALTILFYGESKTGGSGVITDYILRKCFN